MADGSVKIDIEADSSKFESELKEIESEAEKGADGLEDLGKSAEQAVDSLNDLGKSAEQGADGVGNLGKSAEQGAESLSIADVAAGTFVANGLASLISGLADAVASFVDMAETTREYREDMAKLETAFSTQGHSAETASQVYKDFYAVLGESDRSVEAANHLAELTSNEQELAKWSDITAGVLAKFGDSLPIEGLTEAANETAKVGEVTGPLADALNWAAKEGETFGVALKENVEFTELSEKQLKRLSDAQREEYEATKKQYEETEAWNKAITEAASAEDLFNLALSECATEQERSALITETLNGMYAEAAAEYNELTESTQNARLATAEMEEAQANVGAALEPVTTAWTNLKANALEAILPVIQWVADAIMDLNTWLKEHETAATIITGVVIALAAAFGVFAAALGISTLIQLVTSAIASLSAVMAVLASPITIIVAVIAALAAGFIYLWNNCEGFREFWIGLWEGIKEAAAAVADWFNETWPVVVDWLKETWDSIGDFFSDLWDGISETAKELKEDIVKFFTDAWSGIQAVWALVSPYFSAIWETIKGIFAVVKAVLSGNFSDAWIAIKGIVGVWVQYFSGVWANIKGVFAVVGGWFRGIFQDAKDGIAAIWDTITGYFTGVWDDIKGVFGDAVSVGEKIVADLKSGIASAWDGIVSWFNGLWDRLFSRSATVKTNSDGTIQATPHKNGLDYVPYDGYFAMLHKGERVLTAEENAAYSSLARASVGASGASVSRSAGHRDSGFVDLARAVGLQTAGISSLSAQYRAGAANSRPIVLELDGRELGRAIVDVGDVENNRRGVRLAVGGAL